MILSNFIIGKSMKIFIVALITLTFLTAFPAKANKTSYSIDYIHGEGNVDGIKVAMQFHTDYLKKYSKNMSIYFESSINLWKYGVQNRHDTNFVLAISPVFQYPIGAINNFEMFAEFGIGLSLLNDTKFAGKNVSTHYQFEDRLGIMTRFGKNNANQISLRYFHYSNGGLKKPNPGLDFISFSYMRYL